MATTDPLTTLPERLHAGATLKLRMSFADYPANGGWTATLYLAGVSGADPGAGTPDGVAFLFTLSASESAALDPGMYQWRVVVVHGTHGTFIAATGQMDILPVISQATSGDMETREAKWLRIVELALDGRLPSDMQSYVVAGRSVTKIPMLELMDLRNRLANIVHQQKHPDQFGREVNARFVQP